MNRCGNVILLLALIASCPALAELPQAPPAMPVVDREVPRDLDGLTALDAAELVLEDVLLTLELHPVLGQAEAKVAAAEGKQLSAEGAFDTVVGSKFSGMPTGYYSPLRIDLAVEQPTTLWGTRFYAGYQLGVGDSAAYEGKKETLNLGELRAGVAVPLWAGGPIDEERAAIAIAKYDVERYKALQDAKRIELGLKARLVYAKWLVAGQQLAFAEQQRSLAQARYDALQRQVDQGLAAEIEVTDMRRTLLERESKVISSEQKLQSAALSLAFFYRDGAGNPIVPGRAQLPTGWVSPSPPGLADLAALREEARRLRPEYQAMAQRVEQLRVERDLFDNKLAPKIDLSAEVAQDFGEGGHLSALNSVKSKGAFEVSLGLSVSWSFQQREARGKLEVAQAQLSQVELELQVLDEQIALEIQDALVAYNAALLALEASRESWDAARALENAARRRYTLGSTDLLTVYQREQISIKAFDAVLSSWLELHLASAFLNASVGRSW